MWTRANCLIQPIIVYIILYFYQNTEEKQSMVNYEETLT